MAQVQEVWAKLNPRERLTAIGAGLILASWILGLVARGFGVGSIGLVGALAVLVVLYLKYTNSSITWPAPVPLINLAISAIVGILALLTLLEWLSFIDLLGITAILSLGLYVVGAGLMAWGAYQEWQIDKPTISLSGTTQSSPPSAAPTAPPPAAPAAPAAPASTAPPAATAYDDNEAPPA